MRYYIGTILLFLLCLTGAAHEFIENRGQWEGPFRFKADLPNGAVFLEPGAIVFNLFDADILDDIHDRKISPDASMRYHAFRLEIVGADLSAPIEAVDTTKHYYNFYLGNNPKKWKTGIHGAGTVAYRGIYPGIDLLVMKRDNRMKYEFRVAPNADPSHIAIRVVGADGTKLDFDGNLVIRTSLLDIIESKPYIFQDIREEKRMIDGAFVLDRDIIRYEIAEYNERKELIIDPEIIFSTYTGSSSDNWGFTAAPDNNGYLYTGGIVFGTGYPTTSGAYDVNFNGGEYDVSLTKFDTSGTSLEFSTYLGGNSLEHPHSMIVNDDGSLYVMGSTGSGNFPTTNNAYDQSFEGGPSVSIVYSFSNGSDIFVCKFNPSGTSLLGSTFLGGTDNDGLNLSFNLAYNYSDEFRGEVNLDEDGNVYVVSSTLSDDFPVVNAIDATHNGGQDAVIVKLDGSLSNMLWGTYLGGSLDEAGYGIDIASDSSIYIAGGTESENFPVSTNPYQSSFQGGISDGFMAHINAAGTSVLHATYYGSDDYDQLYFVQLDRKDKPHFFGQTEHNQDDLIFNANFNNFGGGQIVGVLESDLGSRIWTTQFGSTPGQPNISPTAFLVDVCNSVYLSGWGGGPNNLGNGNPSDVGGLPVTNDAFQSSPDSDNSDFYLAVIASDGNSLEFGSFYGGSISDDHVDGGTSRFDRGGQIYQSVCAGCQGYDDFPIVPDPGAWSETNNSSNCNNGAFKIDFQLPIVVADFDIPSFACAPYTLNIQNNSVVQSNTSFNWSFGNGQTSTSMNPSTTYEYKGVYTVTLIVSDPNSCNLADTLVREITISKDTNYTLPDLVRCIGSTVVIGPNPEDYSNLGQATISWLPSNVLDNPSSLNPTATVENTTTFRLVIDYGGCQERILQTVTIDRYPITTSEDTIICSDFSPFTIVGSAFGQADSFAWSDSPDFDPILSTDSFLNVDTLYNAVNYFYFRTTKPNGCQMYDTVMVTISDQDIELTADTGICRNEPFRIEALSQNPKNTFDYYWTKGGYSTDPNDVIQDLDKGFIEVILTQPDTFYLVAISTKIPTCSAQDSVALTVSLLDLNDVHAYAEQDTFYRGQLIQLYGEPATGYEFSWTPTKYMTDSNSATPQVRPKEKSSYIWTVSDSLVPGCTASDTITLSPYEILCDTPEIYLPNAFSPNGDAMNEALLVRGRNIESMTLIIHDRWGNEVFRSNNQSVGWDGKYKGERAVPGVYVYQLEATCPTQEVYRAKGNVTIVK